MAVKDGVGSIGRSLHETVLHLIAGHSVLVWIAIASGRPIPLPDNPGSGSSGQSIGFSRSPSAAPHFQAASASTERGRVHLIHLPDFSLWVAYDPLERSRITNITSAALALLDRTDRRERMAFSIKD